MTRTTPLAMLLLGLLLLTSLACQQAASEETATPASEPASTSKSDPADAGSAPEPAVEYEPAYPSDVSSEELSESDVAQQEKHSHGDGEEHEHGEEEHDHGEEEHDGHQH